MTVERWAYLQYVRQQQIYGGPVKTWEEWRAHRRRIHQVIAPLVEMMKGLLHG